MRLNAVATIAKLFPLILIAAAGAFFVHRENFQVTVMPAAGDIARTSLILIFAFAGIESALIPSGEVRDNERTVPRAIALAMLGITALYIALQMVAQIATGRHRLPGDPDAGAGDHRDVREARDPRQRLGPGALLRLRRRLVETERPAGRASAGWSGDPLVAHRSDRR